MADPLDIDQIRRAVINTSTIADILDAYGIDSALDPAIRPLNVNAHYFVGYAYTVEWALVRKGDDILHGKESTWNDVRNFLVPELKDGKDRVYIAGVGPILTTAALAGGLSSNYFQKMGFEGVILGGAVRDIPELKKLSIPVLASNPIPVDTQGAYRVISTGRNCVINNKIIQTGDLIVSDESGTVVIPKDRIEEVIAKAIDIDAVETRILALVKGGARLEEIVSEQGRI